MTVALDRDGLRALLDEFVTAVGDGDHGSRGWPSSAYRVSKVAVGALTRIDAAKPTGRAHVNAVCPGWVRTDMGGQSASRDVSEGAEGVVWAAMLDREGPTGGFFRDGAAIPW